MSAPATPYVQVQPNSSGEKVQVFENILDLTNTVAAQATVPVTAQGVETGSVGNPLKIKSVKIEELLWLILKELRVHNCHFREVNPILLVDSAESVGEYSTFMADANG